MPGPGDIPIVSGRGGRRGPEPEGLVWVVDGHDQPFRDASETQRPWLEDSVDWAGGSSAPDDAAAPPASSDDLVWL
ncbi:MAG: hypothetical protein Q4B45_03495 [Coriobacteriia bacterium]|nr:hypothetical protein [Coriobacteriia bacterium]